MNHEIDNFPAMRIAAGPDGLLSLVQPDGAGGEARVSVHKVHVVAMGRALGLLDKRGADTQAQHIERLHDGVRGLYDHVTGLYDFLRSVPCFPPSKDVPEDVALAMDVLDALEEILARVDAYQDTEVEPTVNPEPTQAKPLGCEHGAQIALEV